MIAGDVDPGDNRAGARRSSATFRRRNSRRGHRYGSRPLQGRALSRYFRPGLYRRRARLSLPGLQQPAITQRARSSATSSTISAARSADGVHRKGLATAVLDSDLSEDRQSASRSARPGDHGAADDRPRELRAMLEAYTEDRRAARSGRGGEVARDLAARVQRELDRRTWPQEWSEAVAVQGLRRPTT